MDFCVRAKPKEKTFFSTRKEKIKPKTTLKNIFLRIKGYCMQTVNHVHTTGTI